MIENLLPKSFRDKRNELLDTTTGKIVGTAGAILVMAPLYAAAKIFQTCLNIISNVAGAFMKAVGCGDLWENAIQPFFNKAAKATTYLSDFFKSGMMFGARASFEKTSSALSNVSASDPTSATKDLEETANFASIKAQSPSTAPIPTFFEQATSMFSRLNAGSNSHPTYWQNFISMFRSSESEAQKNDHQI